MYDITDVKSFENIQNWMKSIKEVGVRRSWGHWGGGGGINVGGAILPVLSRPQNASAGVERLLIGNKCDMEGKRKVQRDEAEKV